MSLGPKKRFNRMILNLDGVQRTVDKVTRRFEGESRARLAKHRRTGDHGIRVYQDRHTRVIELYSKSHDGAPMSIQFGHWQKSPDGKTSKWMPGLSILPTSRGDHPGAYSPIR